jgi:predicted heme/steroid binding protein
MKLFYMVLTLVIFGFGSLFAQDMNLKELSKYNGKNGQKAYIAVDGKIYDVSNNDEWKNGEHIPTQGKLKAGIDGTQVIEKSPHGKKVLAELPVVGNLIK